MEISIIIALILTILILLFSGIRQHSTFREKENFHKIRMQQTEHSFAAERKVFIQREIRLRKKLREKIDEVILLKKQPPSSPQPKYNEPPPELFHANSYWVALSAWYRREQDWMCEECGIDLKRRTHFLHVHHIHGRHYNAPEYLIALCIRCHANQPRHAFMKDSPEYQNFMKWRNSSKTTNLTKN